MGPLGAIGMMVVVLSRRTPCCTARGACWAAARPPAWRAASALHAAGRRPRFLDDRSCWAWRAGWRRAPCCNRGAWRGAARAQAGPRRGSA
eukprot:3815470-Pyramimonas_sp.AAC.1